MKPIGLWLACLLLLLTACRAGPQPETAGRIRLQVLGINDFHGHLEAPQEGWKTEQGTIPSGGVAYLAAAIDAHRSEEPHTLVVSAGDLIGASPLISGLFHDEPTIEVWNQLGLDLNAVGNHEFDEGPAELQRMQHGGCHPEDGCQVGKTFKGASFSFLAANVRDRATQKTIFPPYKVFQFEGVPVAFIGMTLKNTPKITPPITGQKLSFAGEAETANALVKELKAKGIKAIVVLIHEGGFNEAGYNGCKEVSGPIVEIVNQLDPEIDLVMSGHTHKAYNCIINQRRVTSAGSFGRLYTRALLELDPSSRDVVSVVADNHIVTHDKTEKPEIARMVDHYRELAKPVRDRPIGVTVEPILVEPNLAGESQMGNLVADAQLWATQDAGQGGAQMSFMNIGGVRASWPTPGRINYDAIYRVQPFRNRMVTVTLPGEAVFRILENQFGAEGRRTMAVSQGLRYRWDPKRPFGQRVYEVRLHGKPLDPKASYRVSVNGYLLKRAPFNEGTDAVTGVVDTEAFATYIKANSPIKAPKLDRIQRDSE